MPKRLDAPSRRDTLKGLGLMPLATIGMGTIPASAQGLEDPSKSVSLLVSHAAGGGYDAYARLYGRHLSRFLPGQPAVTVRNMPGAAGVVMANHMATQAAHNGSVIALGPGSIVTAALFTPQSARYDARHFTWIGSLNNDVSVVVARDDAPVKTVQDLFTHELVVGGAGASDNSVVHATILKKLFGAKLRLVSGYNGSGHTVLALERGEVQGIAGWNYASITTMRPDWLKTGKIRVLLQMSLTRHPALPNVPTVLDIAKNDEQREILRILFAQSMMGRVLFGPPDMPADMAAAHRAAFDKMLGDADFKADVARSRLEISGPMTGSECSHLVEDLYKSSAARVHEAASLLSGS